MKQCVIALVRFDMVNDGCGYHLITSEVKLTQWLLLKLMITQAIPTLSVVEVMPGGTGCHIHSNKKPPVGGHFLERLHLNIAECFLQFTLRLAYAITLCHSGSALLVEKAPSSLKSSAHFSA